MPFRFLETLFERDHGTVFISEIDADDPLNPT
jgi:hypothetical protein